VLLYSSAPPPGEEGVDGKKRKKEKRKKGKRAWPSVAERNLALKN